jgi:hypothetical protein
MTFLYFALTLSVLLGLALTIHAIAKAIGDCPDTGRAARAAGVTIATGFLAIGGGVVAIIAGFMLMVEPNAATMLGCAGLAVLILGLGFTHAITTLRAVVLAAKPKAALPEPALA